MSNDLRIADAPERAQRGEQINSLEQIGFSLGIEPQEHMKAWFKSDIEPPDISEVTQF